MSLETKQNTNSMGISNNNNIIIRNPINVFVKSFGNFFLRFFLEICDEFDGILHCTMHQKHKNKHVIRLQAMYSSGAEPRTQVWRPS